jgi:hypothetical protein
MKRSIVGLSDLSDAQANNNNFQQLWTQSTTGFDESCLESACGVMQKMLGNPPNTLAMVCCPS